MAIETCAEKQARLAEWDAKLFLIASGGSTVRVRSGDKEVQYGPANLSLFRTLRGALAGEVAACTGVAVGRRRALYITPYDG